ncbi:MAG: hypothetical protein AAFX06_16730 [Planctomycetota bacterium]
MNCRQIYFATICLCLAFTVGCGPKIETAIVTGTLTKGGQPLDGVMVYFMPDPTKGTAGGVSSCVTDEEGKFVLNYGFEDGDSGAAIGWHCVTLEDFVSENFRGPGRPPASRVPKKYMDPFKTPLKVEVIDGEQDIALVVE